MVRIGDLKARRNEWLSDDGTFVLMDADGCVYRIASVYVYPHSLEKRWATAWSFIDTPWAGENLSASLKATAEEAMAWVDSGLCEHFRWFEREAA